MFNHLIKNPENIMMLKQESMGVLELLQDKKFNLLFSFILGVGIICILRPVCSGSDCNITKAPSEKDFDKYVYRMGSGTCYEFKTEIVTCPASGSIEAFRDDPYHDQFVRRTTPIPQCGCATSSS
jgi:hypothetical protein